MEALLAALVWGLVVGMLARMTYLALRASMRRLARIAARRRLPARIRRHLPRRGAVATPDYAAIAALEADVGLAETLRTCAGCGQVYASAQDACPFCGRRPVRSFGPRSAESGAGFSGPTMRETADALTRAMSQLAINPAAVVMPSPRPSPRPSSRPSPRAPRRHVYPMPSDAADAVLSQVGYTPRENADINKMVQWELATGNFDEAVLEYWREGGMTHIHIRERRAGDVLASPNVSEKTSEQASK